jgi:phage tail-like protein
VARPDPFRAYRFLVEIDGTEQGGFQTVSGIERDTKIEPYREGGVNDHERQIAGLTTYPALKLKRGLVDSQLWEWHQDVIAGTVRRKTISVVLLDDVGGEAWRWVVAEAFPSKWSGAELDAGQSTLATEAVEFVHHGLTRQ